MATAAARAETESRANGGPSDGGPSDGGPSGGVGFRSDLAASLRRLSVCTLAGGLLGVLVGGVGGRLAMMLLARLNPIATGVESDDGFRMGQFTASGSLNLLAVGLFLGLFGGAIYAVVRLLMIGPRWFQVLSIAGGPAVVVGTVLVNTDGVDFTLLQPALLAIGLFMFIPGLYGALLTLLAERWLRPGSWSERRPLGVMAVPLLLLIPLVAPMVVLSALWLIRQGYRHRDRRHRDRRHRDRQHRDRRHRDRQHRDRQHRDRQHRDRPRCRHPGCGLGGPRRPHGGLLRWPGRPRPQDPDPDLILT